MAAAITTEPKAAAPVDVRWSLAAPRFPPHGLALGSISFAIAAALLSALWRSPHWHAPSAAVNSDIEVRALEVWKDPQTALQDFDFLQNRVMEEHSWDAGRAEGAIREYLRFMQMLAEAPKMELVASSDVDLVWHEHLIDTQNYAADCLRLFGRFLHHRRARTSDELAAIPAAYERTKRRYAERFGLDAPVLFWGPETEASSMCGGGGGGLLDPAPSNSAPAPNSSEEKDTTTQDTTAQPSASTSSACGKCSNIFFHVMAGIMFSISVCHL